MIQTLVLMSKYPIHKNLNTSFVNLSALVRHLRSLQFVGTVQIELSSYEADIEFGEDGSITACEQDHIAGRLSFGDDALRRIMIRAKEAGGVVNVYKSDDEQKSDGVFVDEMIANRARRMAAPSADKAQIEDRMEDYFTRNAIAELPISRPTRNFDADSVENWTELIGLVSELMQTVDESLSKSGVNFADIFRNACGFISFEHPFLDPDTDIFSYGDGYISLRQKIASHDLISGVTAALARIMERLQEDPYFGNVCHLTMHRIRVLANRRQNQFERFGIRRELQKIIGI